MFSGLDSVFLPLRHAGTAEIQRINKSVKLAGIEKPMTDVSSENIPVFIVIKKSEEKRSTVNIWRAFISVDLFFIVPVAEW